MIKVTKTTFRRINKTKFIDLYFYVVWLLILSKTQRLWSFHSNSVERLDLKLKDDGVSSLLTKIDSWSIFTCTLQLHKANRFAEHLENIF